MTLQDLSPGEQLMGLSVEPAPPPYLRLVFNGMVWPPVQELEARLAPRALGDPTLLDESVTWATQVLKPEWVAPDLRSRFTAATAIVSGRDAFLARYAIDGTKIQIVVTHYFLHITIAPAGGSLGGDGLTALYRYLQMGETIPPAGAQAKWSVTDVQGFQLGYQSVSDPQSWRDSVNYLTNGRAVKFSMRKIASTPGGASRKTGFAPSEESDRVWFRQTQ